MAKQITKKSGQEIVAICRDRMAWCAVGFTPAVRPRRASIACPEFVPCSLIITPDLRRSPDPFMNVVLFLTCSCSLAPADCPLTTRDTACHGLWDLFYFCVDQIINLFHFHISAF